MFIGSNQKLNAEWLYKTYLKKTGSLTPAWYISLITSWRRILADGIPIPWEMESTGPTLYIAYLK